MEVQPHTNRHHVLQSAVECGSGAAVLSAAVLALCSRRDQKRAVGGFDGSSQWLGGVRGAGTRSATLKNRVAGYLAHLVESVLWGAVYTAVFRDTRAKSVSQVLAEAAGTGAAAYAVDYNLTPKRLRPGQERLVSVQSMVAVYAGFALGLAAVTFLRRNSR